MQKRRGLISSIFICLMLFAGVALLLYPTVADWWNGLHQSRAVKNYEAAVESLTTEDYSKIWTAVKVYNEALQERGMDRFAPTLEESEQYTQLLDITGTGIMAYIEIPRLNIKLPIYHGTGDAVLQVAVGHLEGSSLPSGEPGTHIAVSGHTGLPSAKLFTHLPELESGDTFTIHVLDRILTYTIDQIQVVEPRNMEPLAIEENASLCTLITCTPYGVNSHRLLVRGSLSEKEGGD